MPYGIMNMEDRSNTRKEQVMVQNRVEYDLQAEGLIVSRRGKSEVIQDVYKAHGAQAKVNDNGSLIIYSGNQVFGVYPAGAWLRVTPEVSQGE